MSRPPVDVDALEITRTETDGRGRYSIPLPDGSEARLTYSRRADGVMVIDHAGVPPPYEGRGIALMLVRAAIGDARDQGFAIVPLCPYVAAQFRRHPDWSDLQAR